MSVMVVHRRAGKTVLAVLLLIDRAMKCQRPDGRYAYISPLLRQSRDVAWPYLRRFTAEIPGVELRESDLSVTLPNRAVIRCYGADNPDSLRGIYLDGLALDEVGQLRPEVWGEILRPTLADRRGWLLAIGTPKGQNAFSAMYQSALSDPSGEWAAMVYRPEDTGALTEDELGRLRQELTDSQYRQEIECDWGAANADAVIPMELAQAAASRVMVEAEYRWSPVVLGVDVARYGDSRTVICRRQGRACFPPLTMRGLSVTEVASQVARQINDHQPVAVFIDAGGVGAGVVDVLRTLGYAAIGVDFGGRASSGAFLNRRAEMWWAVRTWMQGGGAIPRDEALIYDLCGPTYRYGRTDGRMAIESKDELRERGVASPDAADALALTFADPVPAVIVDERMEVVRGSQYAQMDYQPWR